MKLIEAEHKVHRAARRLERSVDMGKVGRRNARKAMLHAVHHLLVAMDAEYPKVKAPRIPGVKEKRKRLSVEQRQRQLHHRGWRPVVPPLNSTTVEACAIAGVRVLDYPTQLHDAAIVVPGWVAEMHVAHPQATAAELGRLLKRYKHDRAGRAQLLSEAILKSQPKGDQP